MRGVTKGQASSAATPTLQFFARNGEFLENIHSGTYQIDDITGSSAVSRVASTAINTADAPGGQKLGTGRYVIPTGSTSGWAYGTHRVTVSFKFSATGDTYTIWFDFELLSSIEFPNGAAYSGFASTKDLLRDGHAGSLTADNIHRHIHRISRQLEHSLRGRWFEPRYMTMQLDSPASSVLWLDEAVIALEKVEAVSQSPNLNEVVYLYPQDVYKVYNRHLDGLLDPDDRDNPRLELVSPTAYYSSYLGTPPDAGVGRFSWPEASQHVYATGVFGYTEYELGSNRSHIGEAPYDVRLAVGVLLSRHLADPLLADVTTHNPGNLRSYRTRDQAISLGGTSSGGIESNQITGDALLDLRLARFMKWGRASYIERKS